MGSLPMASSVLAVCAHPDDESFGLGAALAAFAARGTPTAVLCLTHGAASALGTSHGGLHQVRAAELSAAARELGAGDVTLLDYPDGALAHEPAELLSGHVQQAAAALNSEFGTSFAGRTAEQIDCSIEVGRRRQLSAIACHASQAHDNPVLWRRLELQGNREVFRWLRRAGETGRPRLTRPARHPERDPPDGAVRTVPRRGTDRDRDHPPRHDR